MATDIVGSDDRPEGSGSTETGNRQLCFVLMPFGRKTDASGMTIDFDSVYEQLIAPAVRAADLEVIRADEELVGGIVHKPMFERLILCEYAVADLTFANANVFYELGVRHAVRPYSTVLLFGAGTRLPFDVQLDRALPYPLSANGELQDPEPARQQLTDRLLAAREASVDSPVFQLVDGFPDIERLKTDVFRERVHYAQRWKERLATAREQGLEAVRAAEGALGALHDVESGVLIDLYLSYRAVEGYEEMVALVDVMPRPLARTPMVREQLALAWNRLGRRREAERTLTELIDQRGPSSETYGILGRVYKDQWQDAVAGGQELLAKGLLDKAIGAYLIGFETDWRDAYPGINAVTLMEVRQPPDPRRDKLVPVVTYAAERRLASTEVDYWDHATRLELAVLDQDAGACSTWLTSALAAIREGWEPETTANNLRLIRHARQRRGVELSWAEDAERELLDAARRFRPN
jgi:hypothetical protein